MNKTRTKEKWIQQLSPLLVVWVICVASPPTLTESWSFIPFTSSWYLQQWKETFIYTCLTCAYISYFFAQISRRPSTLHSLCTTSRHKNTNLPLHLSHLFCVSTHVSDSAENLLISHLLPIFPVPGTSFTRATVTYSTYLRLKSTSTWSSARSSTFCQSALVHLICSPNFH